MQKSFYKERKSHSPVSAVFSILLSLVPSLYAYARECRRPLALSSSLFIVSISRVYAIPRNSVPRLLARLLTDITLITEPSPSRRSLNSSTSMPVAFRLTSDVILRRSVRLILDCRNLRTAVHHRYDATSSIRP